MSMTDTDPDAVWYCTFCAFLGTASEADAHLVVKPKHVLSPMRTRTGRIVTNAEVDGWVAEAERGYDVQPAVPPQLPPGWSGPVACGTCDGHGVVDGYDAGPLDCRSCNGGVYYVSPRGFTAAYPGGPWLGGRHQPEPVT